MKSKLRIGHLDYVNTLPLYTAMRQGDVPVDVEWVSGSPIVLNDLIYRKQLDVSFVSSAEYLQHKSDYVELSPFGIAAYGFVYSVLLYHKGEIQDMDNKTIGVTAQSLTSVHLLSVLCHHYWHIKPHMKAERDLAKLKAYDSFMLIGDDALLHPEFPGYTTVDLSQAWKYATGFPFVFGLLVASAEAMEKRRDDILAFVEKLKLSLKWAEANPETIITLAKKKCPISEEKLRLYFKTLYYKVGKREEHSLALFDELRACELTLQTIY